MTIRFLLLTTMLAQVQIPANAATEDNPFSLGDTCVTLDTGTTVCPTAPGWDILSSCGAGVIQMTPEGAYTVIYDSPDPMATTAQALFDWYQSTMAEGEVLALRETYATGGFTAMRGEWVDTDGDALTPIVVTVLSGPGGHYILESDFGSVGLDDRSLAVSEGELQAHIDILSGIDGTLN